MAGAAPTPLGSMKATLLLTYRAAVVYCREAVAYRHAALYSSGIPPCSSGITPCSTMQQWYIAVQHRATGVQSAGVTWMDGLGGVWTWRGLPGKR